MQLEPRLRAIVAQEYPRFSDAEFARRHQALARVTIYDDLMHGFGGVQPNVITRDQEAGVQVGELIRVTKTGFERLHNAPRGFWRAPLGGAASTPSR